MMGPNIPKINRRAVHVCIDQDWQGDTRVILFVRNVVHNRPVKNVDALANPEAPELFRSRPELAE